MREGRFADVAAAILLGGASSRMGRDKGHVEVGGVAAATRLARLAASLFEDVALVGGAPPAEAPGRRVADRPGPPCALRGVATALAEARAPRVLVLAVDLPLLTPDVLLALVACAEADVVAPRTPGGLEPLCALYRVEAALPLARARLASGELSLQGLLGALDVATLQGDDLASADPDGSALLNVNTPDDLARAESLLAARAGRRAQAASPRRAGGI